MAKTKDELEAMTKDELVAYADDHDIDTHHGWLKEEIVAAIVKGEKKAAKEDAKHGAAHKDEKPADQKIDPALGVSPEMAELQRQANTMLSVPDDEQEATKEK
jgi:hypothetical protein